MYRGFAGGNWCHGNWCQAPAFDGYVDELNGPTMVILREIAKELRKQQLLILDTSSDSIPPMLPSTK